MSVKLLYFDGCPNWQQAEERLLAALEATGRSHEGVARELVCTPEAAERLRFRGSPTILIDGEDPFSDPSSAAVGLACRLFETPDGLRGAPTVDQLVEALQ